MIGELTAEETMTLAFVADRELVSEARQAVRIYLGRPCPDVQLCLSELLANVIRHVGEGTPVTVRLTRAADGRTRLEVTDSGPPAVLVARDPGRYEETGRGLMLLDAIAERWGMVGETDGKTVWCELAAEEPPDTPRGF
ncbi:ATP-binding protein [Streptomyces sp. NPDC059477]|uniref:ATP-binding protein n=1 Tax=Streptomyces sp. NPDC059477 TaxID=3346847 RepID=UPI0036BCAC93